MIASGLLPVLKRYMLIYIIASVFMTIGGVLIYSVDANIKTGAIYYYEVIVAIRTGLIL